MNLNENDGAQGASKTFNDVGIGKAFRMADGVKYAKVSTTEAVRLDTATRETIDPGQGVYEYGAYSFAATYSTWGAIAPGQVARIGNGNFLKLSDGVALDLSNFEFGTPGSGDPLAVATNVDGSFDP